MRLLNATREAYRAVSATSRILLILIHNIYELTQFLDPLIVLNVAVNCSVLQGGERAIPILYLRCFYDESLWW